MAMAGHKKVKVLIVNAYFDPWRSATPTRWFIPRAMAPYYLAGYFDPQQCDVKVWDEVFHGAFLKTKLFSWPDLVVFTGLTACFDRAHQLSAYFRHANPKVVTVIGGPIPRALPALCHEIFDYVCQGDVEDISDVIADIFGPSFIADIPSPRLDLARPMMGTGYVETTKYCNFTCSFCALTGENRKYQPHSDQSITRQLDGIKKTFAVMVMDNNFYGNNREDFLRRVEMIGDRWRQGQFRSWGALVTGDFFKRPENVALVAKNGCRGLFSGVESFDPDVLKSFNKKQSLTAEPRDMARICAEAGMFFDYGLLADFTRQTVADVDLQLQAILEDPAIALPALVALTIPIVGTPYFEQSVQKGSLLPNLLLSDMDGQKLIEWPKEPLETVAAYIPRYLKLKGQKLAVAKHAARHAWHWRKHLACDMTALSLVLPLQRFGLQIGFGSLRQMRQSFREPPLTYCATTDRLRAAYTPLMRLPAAAEKCFKPLRVTNDRGQLTETFQKARSSVAATA